MSLSSEAIDLIVANVLKQISPAAKPTAVPKVVGPVASPKMVDIKPAGQISLPGNVITASQLEAVAIRSIVTVSPKAIVTPAAWDAIKARQLQLQRGNLEVAKSATAFEFATPKVPGAQRLLIVVRSTKSVEQVWEGLAGRWKRELLGCPDDAAKLAIGELTRGGATAVVILAEQTHRAACLANRNEAVKAAAVQDVSDVKAVRQQIRANVWCINPGNRSFFELKNLFQQIETVPAK